MAATFQKLQPDNAALVKHANGLSASSAWSKFDNVKPTLVEKFSSAVSCVHCVGSSLAVTVSNRIVLYHIDAEKKDGVVKQRVLTKFEGEAMSGRIRFDEKLVASGSENGVVRVFDYSTRSAMRTFTSHTSSVRIVKWSLDGFKIFSGSDDFSSKLFDLSSGEEVCAAFTHADRIRSIETFDENVYITGGYDHAIKLWDVRIKKANVLTIKEEAPIETLLCFAPSEHCFFSSSMNVVSKHDVRNFGRAQIQQEVLHQKTITAMVLGNKERRELLSASLDGGVKIFRADDLQDVHLIKFHGSILSLCASFSAASDAHRLIAGTAEGEFVVKTKRGLSIEERNSKASIAHPVRAGSLKHFTRGTKTEAEEADYLVEGEVGGKRIKLKPFELHLKRFEYKQALDAALVTQDSNNVITLLEELNQRSDSALIASLSGRDESALEPILSFVIRFIVHPFHTTLLLHIAQLILSIYANVLGESATIDALFDRLLQAVRREVDKQKEWMKVQGKVLSALRGDV